MNSIYPELQNIYKQVNKRCILDGELIVMKDGVPDFYEIQKRAMMTNSLKIQIAMNRYPASFTAYDILYINNEQITNKPLLDRKDILQETIIENNFIAISRYIPDSGITLYNLTVEHNLEGIVAKKKDSKYYFDKKSKDWIKIKNLKDEDFVICGYIEKMNNIISLILGAYDSDILVRQGHVTLGVTSEVFKLIKEVPVLDIPIFKNENDKNAIWINPKLVCTVKYMMKSEDGGMRQPVFKGLRDDKDPRECKL